MMALRQMVASSDRIVPATSQKPLVRSILPVLLQPRDRFIDEEGVWEVINRPWSTRGGTLIHVTVQKPSDPSTRRDKIWRAHEHLAIRRA